MSYSAARRRDKETGIPRAWVNLRAGALKYLDLAVWGVGFLLCALPWTSRADSVTLAWDPSPDPFVVGYNVHYRLIGGCAPIVRPVGLETTVVLDGLDPWRT